MSNRTNSMAYMSSCKISQEASNMITNGYGYRDDLFYGSGEVNFEHIIDFEVFELGNTDILKTCKNLYNINIDLRNRKESVNSVVSYFKKLYKTDMLYGVWICDFSDVSMYDSGNGLLRVLINKNSMVASDLSKEGVLWVSDMMFKRIYLEEEM